MLNEVSAAGSVVIFSISLKNFLNVFFYEEDQFNARIILEPVYWNKF